MERGIEIHLAILAGLGGMFGWGLADFFAKKTVDKLGSVRTLLWVQTFGILPILIYFILNREAINFSFTIFFYLVLISWGDLLAYFFFYRGLRKGLVSILSPVFAAQSGVSVLVSAFIFGERISINHWMGLIMLLLGIVLVSLQIETSGNKLNLKNISQGLPEVLIGMIIYGFYFPCWDWFLKYQKEGWVTSVILTRVFLVVTLVTTVWMFSLTKKIKTNLSAGNKMLWMWLMLVGLFDAMAMLFAAWGYRFTTITSVVVVLSGAFPLPVIVLARIFLKERLLAHQIIGASSIIIGLIILAIFYS